MTGQNQIRHSGKNHMAQLEEIKGLGPDSAKALYRAGIRQLEDLVQTTPQEIEDLLREGGVTNITAKKIESQDWIGQAKHMLRTRPAQVAYSQADEDEEQQASRKEMAVHPHAQFTLFFDYVTDENGEHAWQTRVWQNRSYQDDTDERDEGAMHTRVWQTTTYHDETGDEAIFDGIEPSLWVRWILEHAELSEFVQEPSSTEQLAATTSTLGTEPLKQEDSDRETAEPEASEPVTAEPNGSELEILGETDVKWPLTNRLDWLVQDCLELERERAASSGE